MSRSPQVGESQSVRRVFSQTDFDRFAALSGDDNPIHVDPAFAAQTKFGRTVAHGMFLYSVVSGVLGTRLPGPGTLQLEQELMFPSATPTDQEIEVRLEVTRLQPGLGLADLSTVIARPNGELGLQGRTLVRLPGAASTVPPANLPALQPGLFSFKGFEIGQRAETRRRFTIQDLAEYVDLTGDANPIFSDVDYARRVGLPGRVIPGGLLGGLFSSLLGTRLPGRGTNYLKQRLMFPALACPDQELVASVQIVRLRPEKQLVNLITVCTDAADNVMCYGEALVLVSDVE